MDSRNEITRAYRKVFGTGDGQLVLADILNSLGYFDYSQIESDNLALQNKAKEILVKCGILSRGSVPYIIQALFTVPIEKENTSGEQI